MATVGRIMKRITTSKKLMKIEKQSRGKNSLLLKTKKKKMIN